MSNPLNKIDENPPLTYNRNVDYMSWGGREPNDNEQFYKALPEVVNKGKKKQSKKMIFFKKLGVPLRRKIYSYVYEIPPTYKEVNLSMDFTVKAVFPPGHFIVPWDLIKEVAGALLSGRQMRDELLTYFWSTYHFHVTFSAFTTGPTFSGLSVKWLNLYAERVNHLTVEVDFTTLAFSSCKDAKLLSAATHGVHELISNLVDGLVLRVEKNVMATLTLKLRRFWGFRPHDEDADEEDKMVPYCPDDAQYVFEDFSALKWMLLQLRMAGFTIPYTRRLSNSLFDHRVTRPRAVIIPAWPLYNPPPPQYQHLYSMTLDPNASPGGASTSAASASTSSGFAQSISPAADNSVSGLGVSVEEARTAKFASSPGSGIPRRVDSLPTEAPKSPNTMNALNAQDPAFTRAFNAMRLDSEREEEDKEEEDKEEEDKEEEVEKEMGVPVTKKNKKKKKKKKAKKH